MVRPPRRTGLLLLALTLGAGCRFPVPDCPEKGGPPWWHLDVPHFEIWTDLDSNAADLAAYDLERERAALVAAAWSTTSDRDRKVDAIIVRDEVELSAFTNAGGLFKRGVGPHGGVLVAPGDVVGHVFKHELAHALAYQFGLPQATPTWLEEGLACFLESTTYASPSGQLRVGDPGPYYGDVALHDRRTLRALRKGNDLTLAFYGSSWLVVHFLINQRREGLHHFLEQLAQGKGEEIAWSIAFPDLAPEQLDATLADYARQGNYFVKQRAWTPPNVTPLRRAMPDAEAHAARALLTATAGTALSIAERRKRTGQEVDEALRQDPNNPLAQYLRHSYLGL